MAIRNAILLHANARPHTVALTQEILREIHWEIVKYLPYSPDLSPCNYHMFGSLKKDLEGHHFGYDKGVKTFVCNWLLARPDSFSDEKIKKLPIR